MKLFNRKILIQVVLIIGLIIFNSNSLYAEDDFVLYTEGDFQYYIVNGSIEIAKYIGEDSEVTIPYEMGAIEVRSIKDGTFTGTSVTRVTIPDNIAYYGPNAFDPGTILDFRDVYGNPSTDPTGNYQPSGGGTNIIVEKEKGGNGNGSGNSETTGSEFEDDFVDISNDLEPVQETVEEEVETNERNKISIRRRILDLFDASNFKTNFTANKIGYVFISISLAAIIVLLILYLKHSDTK